MRKFLFLLAPLILFSCAQTRQPLGDEPTGQVMTTILNDVIQSEFVQTHQFYIEEECTPSVPDDLEFCDAVKSKKDLCGYLDVKVGYYLYQVENAKGLGALRVTSVSDPVPFPDDTTLFGVNISMDVPTEVRAKVYYEFEADGVPAIKGHMALTTTGVTAIGSGILRETCGDAYYLEISSLYITIPDNVFDSNELTKIAEELMIGADQLTPGMVDLEKKLMDSLNNTVSKETMKALNDVLRDIPIAPSDC